MTYPNIPELLKARVAETPDKPFLFSESDGRSWTYLEFDRAVRRTAAILHSLGIGKGDVVSLLLPNSAEYIVAYFACWHIGAIAGPINSLLKHEEIEWVITNSASKLLLSEHSLVCGGLPRADCSDSSLSPPSSNTANNSQEGRPAPAAANQAKAFGIRYIPFNDIDAVPDATIEAATLASEAEAIIIYTSGTTGKPKGCLLTHGNLIANARQITEWLGFGPEDRLLTVMPLFHMNAVTVTTMTALYCGGSTVVSPKFSASRFWDIIDRYHITSFGSVATMLSMLLAVAGEQGAVSSEESQLTSLRFAMCGSAPVPAEVLKRFEQTFSTLVIEGYGLSESTCRSTFNPPNEDRRPGSCGMPIGNEMKVFDDDDNEVPDGTLGEIVLRGPNIFKGYFKNPAATAQAFRAGWFHTGDIGYRGADGFFYIADRKSDMIIRGGENIYPREIDDLLYTHPAVAAAAVIGVPDDLYGEEVAAFIVIKQGKEVSESDLIDFCRQHFADYKCPKTIHFIADIPKGPTGKLLKRELARLFRAK